MNPGGQTQKRRAVRVHLRGQPRSSKSTSLEAEVAAGAGGATRGVAANRCGVSFRGDGWNVLELHHGGSRSTLGIYLIPQSCTLSSG